MRNSGTERMSRVMIQSLGTGRLWGIAGVKTAKLCTEQDQIGRQPRCFMKMKFLGDVASVGLSGKIA